MSELDIYSSLTLVSTIFPSLSKFSPEITFLNLVIVRNIYKLPNIIDIMSSKFSLLSLNLECDKHPRSWICISGKNIPQIISKIEKEIIKKDKTNREQISKIIANKLHCNNVSIKNILRGKGKFYPIQVILILCELANNESYLGKLEGYTEYLKVNSASAKSIKASRELTPNLAKTIGAFCADGSLSMQFIISSKDKFKLETLKKLGKVQESTSRREYYIAIQVNRSNYENLLKFSVDNQKFNIQTHYNIELTDEHESNVQAFNRWIYEEFKIEPTNYYRCENAFRTVFSNKILARYLITFFDFLPSYKSAIVREPEIIKSSDLSMRKEFAKGIFMFDGTVSKRKIISFTTLSERLAKSVQEILEEDQIKTGLLLSKRNEYVVYTLANQDISKLLEYFDKETKKWELLSWLNKKDFQSDQISYEKDLKETKNIWEIIREVKVCDSGYLTNRLNCSHTSIRQHLKILKSKSRIKLSDKPAGINDFVSNETFILLKERFHKKIFGKLLEKFKTYEKASNFLEVQKGTLSAWKVKKNRIPLYTIKQICKVLEIPEREIEMNIEETDREIVEIILP